MMVTRGGWLSLFACRRDAGRCHSFRLAGQLASYQYIREIVIL